ncbi:MULTISPECIES: TetR family transcriptional regulator [Rhodococcus]|uniref:TetR family transcriptional regulator n=1 Tax=Rhodococcus oxybenzonivorans TaxID=1990687 RepID=A0AAE5A718_9NOCA|nr:MULTISPECIES: TetR family transcriptional regulator [Rhodococcus]MDV7240542.1 TetR family transcriptional regulator [Rhodococcus oxybenzonivorans]MDV7265763.1 TetR family transcriptional regulator [Rhodococcus oxybenzonivorans]MDV7272815.1 TetR family transcriptional regulator [Rhodococcus oxybenzonivorans]MDV7333446.1 TetR family transcriptional regulator [Rhodococcus oxybenzonivorans]MDV7342613.1 TetR family transcriptional regulator [Rhodococcus oxybenzonivorans]
MTPRSTDRSTNSVTAGLRERRVEAIRVALTDTALKLFDASSFDAVSVADIASAAGMSERTFFRYFQSKDDVVLQYERALDARLVDALARRPPGEPPRDALMNAYIETAETPPRYREKVRRRGQLMSAAPGLQIRAWGERQSRVDAISAVLQERQSINQGSDDEWALRILAVAMSAVATEAWTTWVDNGGSTNPADTLRRAFAIANSRWAESADRGAEHS